jgi:hypothetical protein
MTGAATGAARMARPMANEYMRFIGVPTFLNPVGLWLRRGRRVGRRSMTRGDPESGVERRLLAGT